ncbi:XRE family transcriptional regulator [Burkholderia glumae]|uniref:helix-turn-helix domain-containing protein n=1 Tax=Burkholderia glumae TaxID=337 RepID=UPI000F5EAFE6|nr:helix-turn-helix transcriptional regulator [Burkholderia glumae]RQZ76441.1 XRE family transcriptional regulator [Burkholderia glumae]
MSDKLNDEQILKLAEKHHALHPGVDEWWEFRGREDLLAFAHELLAASPAPAIPAEPVPPFGWVQPRGGNYFTRSEVAAKRIGGLMPVYASPPASIAPAISESEDAAPSFKSPLTPFGSLVRSLRVVTGTLLGDMARAMGVSSAELSAMELGRRPIAPEHVGAASEFFQSCGLPRTAPLLMRAVDTARIARTTDTGGEA